MGLESAREHGTDESALAWFGTRNSSLEPVQVAGETGHGYTVTRTTAGVEIVQTQRWVQHGDHLYVVTLSVAASQSDQGQAALREVLETWEWVG